LSSGETGLYPKTLKSLVLGKYPDSRPHACGSGTAREKYFFSAPPKYISLRLNTEMSSEGCIICTEIGFSADYGSVITGKPLFPDSQMNKSAETDGN
jgi:hypothetical protein